MIQTFQNKTFLLLCLILSVFSSSLSFGHTASATPGARPLSRKLVSPPSLGTRQDLATGASLGLGTNSYSPSPQLLTAPMPAQPMMMPAADNSNNQMMMAMLPQMLAALSPSASSNDRSLSSLNSRSGGSRSSYSARGDRGTSSSSVDSLGGGSSPHLSNVPLGENADVNEASWSVAKALENSGIGRGNGYSLNSPVGWAKIAADGSVSIQGPKTSHCTSATHAQFLGTLGALAKSGKITLSSSALKALNSDLFRDAWNSNGYGPARLYELLGGQNFTDLSAAKRGDFVKLDRTNGGGHTAIFSRMDGNQICFWSSNRSTNGVGENCEPRSNFTGMVFSRLTDLSTLQARLETLGSRLDTDPALASVRRKGGNGYVAMNQISVVSTQALRAPAETRSSQASATSSAVR